MYFPHLKVVRKLGNNKLFISYKIFLNKLNLKEILRIESIKHKEHHLSGLFNLEQIFSILWFEMERRSSEKMLLEKWKKAYLLLDYIFDIIISFLCCHVVV